MAESLRRELTLTGATALVISNMIGTGIFTTTGFLAGDLGRPALVLGIWLAGALVALAGCLAYAELGINFPRSGGEYVYLREAWGPAWGFLSGWVSFFAGFSAPIAAGALAFAEYLRQFFPWITTASVDAPGTGYWIRLGTAQLIGVGVIAGFTLVNALGLRLASRLQNTLTLLKLGVLATFLVLAFTIGHGHWSNLAQSTTRTSPHSLGAQFAVSLIFVMFAYSGWNAAAYVAEEMKTPERTLPAALLLGAALVTLFYFALNVAFIFAVPLASLKGVVPVGASAAQVLFGAKTARLFSLIMAVSILSCVSAMVVVGPRVYYAMAQDGCFFAGAARVHGRWRTPTQAILLQALAAAALVITGTFEKLIYYIGFTLILFAALATAGLFRMRRRPGWKKLRFARWHYPWAPALFVVISLWMLVYTLLLRPQESLFGLLTVGLGGLLYRWKFRKRT